jgi:hypothetical protein
MTTQSEVEKFLDRFFEKMRFFDILFRDERGKNQRAMLKLEISPEKRLDIIKSLKSDDYVNGSLPDTLNKSTELWEFGKKVKKKDVYIKITLGFPNSQVICISFHQAERKLVYPFKTTT